MNYFKTMMLLVMLTVLLVWMGGMIGGQHGALLAFILALALNFASWWYSDRIVLAIYKAKEIPKEVLPPLHSMVRKLSEKAGIPAPRLYVFKSKSPNAFATGRNPENAVICVTNGILELLSEEELKGVIAHELSHIKNRDTLIMSVAAALGSAVMMLAYMARWAAIFGGFSGRGSSRDRSGGIIGILAVSLLAPLVATLIQLAISRSREYGADESGARIAGSGAGLAKALVKIEQASSRIRLNAPPQSAHLFIVNPLKGGFIAGLFMTHPPVSARVERLKALQF